MWIKDNYKKTRTSSKFSVYSDQPEDGSQLRHLIWMVWNRIGAK
jgi:hypothetical protein